MCVCLCFNVCVYVCDGCVCMYTLLHIHSYARMNTSASHTHKHIHTYIHTRRTLSRSPPHPNSSPPNTASKQPCHHTTNPCVTDPGHLPWTQDRQTGLVRVGTPKRRWREILRHTNNSRWGIQRMDTVRVTL